MDSDRQRLLATMPLHAITSTYGEAGLRDRFAGQIASWPEADRQKLERALDLAARLHASDRRENEPYVNHLLRVAIRIISHYGVHDTDVVCAALLHDAVEDHAGELAGRAAGTGSARADREAALAVLAAEFGPRVAELVGAVTNPEYAADRDAHEQYREHVADVLQDHPWARIIKVSDFTDNGAGLIHTTGSRLRMLADKYAPLVPVLAELVARPDTPLDAAVKEHILAQLDRAADRFAAMRGTTGLDAVRLPDLGQRHGRIGPYANSAAQGIFFAPRAPVQLGQLDITMNDASQRRVRQGHRTPSGQRRQHGSGRVP